MLNLKDQIKFEFAMINKQLRFRFGNLQNKTSLLTFFDSGEWVSS